MALIPSHKGIQGNERADHLAEVGRLSPALYDKCHPGTVVNVDWPNRPINIDLLHPSPARVGHFTGFRTPLGAQGQCEDVLTPYPSSVRYLGVKMGNATSRDASIASIMAEAQRRANIASTLGLSL